MHPQVQLNIPQPCHENWDKMTPSQQGRFCSACAKEVVDFTTMSDTEVLHYFLDKKNEKVCGRMYPDQLNRSITKPVYPEKKKWWYWNYAAMFLVMFQKSNATTIHGGLGVEHSMIEHKPKFSVKELYNFSKDKLLPLTKVITGKVTDENGEPVSFASIKIKGSSNGISADANGDFSMKADVERDVLQISAVGYETYELALKNATDYNISLAVSKCNLRGEVVVTAGYISSDYDYTPVTPVKHVAVFEVLDNATHQPVKATLSFNKTGYKEENVLTDAKGSYKLKRIAEDDKFTVMVKADGYLANEVEIKGWTFDERKAIKYVFLEKAPVLSDYKQMEAVNVTSYEQGRVRVTMGAVSRVTQCSLNNVTVKRNFADTLNILKTKLTSNLKFAPNPVQRGNVLNVSFSVKQTGNYLLQITNTAGQVVLQQQVVAGAKNNTVSVQTNAGWAGGLYYLRLTDAKNNLLSTNNFIVQ